jgi:hypothetical protein
MGSLERNTDIKLLWEITWGIIQHAMRIAKEVIKISQDRMNSLTSTRISIALQDVVLSGGLLMTWYSGHLTIEKLNDYLLIWCGYVLQYLFDYGGRLYVEPCRRIFDILQQKLKICHSLQNVLLSNQNAVVVKSLIFCDTACNEVLCRLDTIGRNDQFEYNYRALKDAGANIQTTMSCLNEYCLKVLSHTQPTASKSFMIPKLQTCERIVRNINMLLLMKVNEFKCDPKKRSVAES